MAQHGLLVEEFVPERMKVTASTDKPGYAQGAAVPVRVQLVAGEGVFGGERVRDGVRYDPAPVDAVRLLVQFAAGPRADQALKRHGF